MVASSPSRVHRPPRRRCPGIPVRIAEGADGQDLLGASLSLAQTQIAAQLADETSVDARMMGTLGFSGALLAVDVPSRSLLGAAWWVLLIGLGLAIGACFRPALSVRRFAEADVGPPAGVFYSAFNGISLDAARQQLLADLVVAYERNADRIRLKRRALRTAVLILAIGLAATTSVVGLEKSTTIRAIHERVSETS
jgi:hypothetical protein